jgi:hypothetical protein
MRIVTATAVGFASVSLMTASVRGAHEHAGRFTQARADRAALERELAEARARWNANKPANYEFVLNIPMAESPWERRFATFRVTAARGAEITPLTGTMAPLFLGRTTIDALFDLVAERISATPATVSPSYDDEIGYVRGLFSPNYRDLSFEVPVWRAVTQIDNVREPFVLIEHVNHCGFMFEDRRSLSECPSYSIAMWGDGTVVYDGGRGVQTLGRRQHQAGQDAVRDLSRAIVDSPFFAMADDYRSITTGAGLVATTDHAAEKWITVRTDGRQKTVHDFCGAPDVLLRLEAAIEKAADSPRYTGRAESRRETCLAVPSVHIHQD